MEFTPSSIPGVLVLEPRVFGDARGFFLESYNRKAFEAAVGHPVDFVQDNHSLSGRNVLRGLHYQLPHPQGKLLRVIRGEIFDVAVDLRRDSPTYRKWIGVVLSADNRKELYVPEGLAHGFLALSDEAELLYKATDYYHPEAERCIRFDDPTLAVDWPLRGEAPIVSPKDAAGLSLSDSPTF